MEALKTKLPMVVKEAGESSGSVGCPSIASNEGSSSSSNIGEKSKSCKSPTRKKIKVQEQKSSSLSKSGNGQKRKKGSKDNGNNKRKDADVSGDEKSTKNKAKKQRVFLTASELHKYISKTLRSGKLLTTKTLKYNGKESLDELLSRIFVFPSPDDSNFIKTQEKVLKETGIKVQNSSLLANSNKNESLSENEKERLYNELKQKLAEAGVDDENVQNIVKCTKPFQTDEDLLRVLVGDEDESDFENCTVTESSRKIGTADSKKDVNPVESTDNLMNIDEVPTGGNENEKPSSRSKDTYPVVENNSSSSATHSIEVMDFDVARFQASRNSSPSLLEPTLVVLPTQPKENSTLPKAIHIDTDTISNAENGQTNISDVTNKKMKLDGMSTTEIKQNAQSCSFMNLENNCFAPGEPMEEEVTFISEILNKSPALLPDEEQSENSFSCDKRQSGPFIKQDNIQCVEDSESSFDRIQPASNGRLPTSVSVYEEFRENSDINPGFEDIDIAGEDLSGNVHLVETDVLFDLVEANVDLTDASELQKYLEVKNVGNPSDIQPNLEGLLVTGSANLSDCGSFYSAETSLDCDQSAQMHLPRSNSQHSHQENIVKEASATNHVKMQPLPLKSLPDNVAVSDTCDADKEKELRKQFGCERECFVILKIPDYLRSETTDVRHSLELDLLDSISNNELATANDSKQPHGRTASVKARGRPKKYKATQQQKSVEIPEPSKTVNSSLSLNTSLKHGEGISKGKDNDSVDKPGYTPGLENQRQMIAAEDKLSNDSKNTARKKNQDKAGVGSAKPQARSPSFQQESVEICQPVSKNSKVLVQKPKKTSSKAETSSVSPAPVPSSSTSQPNPKSATISNKKLNKETNKVYSDDSSCESSCEEVIDLSPSTSSSDTYVPLLPPSVKIKTSSAPVSSEDDGNKSDSTSYKNTYQRQKLKTPSTEQNDDNIKKLLTQMKIEIKKKKPNVPLLNELLEKTAEYRKTYFEEIKFDVDDGLATFPALSVYELMKAEISRKYPMIKGRTRMEFLEAKLIDHMEKALRKTRKRAGLIRHPLWDEALRRGKEVFNLEYENCKTLGMICLSFHFAENEAPEKLFKLRDKNDSAKSEEMVSPTLDIIEEEFFVDDAKQMWVYAEGLRCIKVPNFYEGVLTAYAMHYAFDIEYDKELKPLFEFFDVVAKIS